MSGYMLAVCVCFGLVAIGEVISYVTKAVIPSMAGALVLYLILIWCGMPQSYPETAGFTTIGDMAFLMLCVGIGTSVAPAERGVCEKHQKRVDGAGIGGICACLHCGHRRSCLRI